jgi:hypothetical protein
MDAAVRLCRMRRLWALTGLILLLLTGPALADNGQQTTTLLTQTGQPVGVQWQRWMNASYAPTYDGQQILSTNLSDYGCAYHWVVLGCSDSTASSITSIPVAPTLQSDPEEALNVAYMKRVLYNRQQTRWMLYYEEGHIVDGLDVTDPERIELLHIWRQQLPPVGESLDGADGYWWSGEASGTGHVYGEWFSEAYSWCSLYRAWDRRDFKQASIDFLSNTFSDGYPGLDDTQHAIATQIATCDYIRTL